MAKTKQSNLQQLKKDYEAACNGYLGELLRMWELDAYYGYWIGDEVGGVYDYGDGMFTINMDDIIHCVDNDVTREQYIEWQEYICDAAEFGFATPNLRSWMKGCPRTSAETFKHLREIKAMLNDAIQDEKERIKERDAQQKIDFDDVDPNHLVHEHIDPPTFEEAQGEKKDE